MANNLIKFIEAQTAAFDLLQENAAFFSNRYVYSINLDVRPVETRVMLKSWSKVNPEIAIVTASSLEQALDVAYRTAVGMRDVPNGWFRDRYYREVDG